MNSNLKAIVIDDEKHARIILKELIALNNLPVEIIGEGENLPQAIELIYALKPQLVFLDIEMPGYSGLQIADFIKDRTNFDIIFVTAYNQFAVQALRLAAFDYLLKPVQLDELTQTVARLKIKKPNLDTNTLTQQFSVLQSNLSTTAKKIVIHTHKGKHFIEMDQIYYLEASGMYTVFHLNNAQLVASKPLKDYEAFLGGIFFRIHRSYIVNCKFVVKYSNAQGPMVTLTNAKMLPVSKNKLTTFLEFLKTVIA